MFHDRSRQTIRHQPRGLGMVIIRHRDRLLKLLAVL